MTLPIVTYPTGEKAILLGRAKLTGEYMTTRGYSDTNTHQAAFKKALNGAEASAIIRALIDAYIANPKIISEVS